MRSGRYNVGVGLMVMALFMAYGFFLIYLRDFAPGKEQWIAEYGLGKHFESRLAHVHGNLFALLNVGLGFVLARVRGFERAREIAAGLGLAGLLMPTGILMEVSIDQNGDLDRMSFLGEVVDGKQVIKQVLPKLNK